jgi:hypothetical protein
MAKRIVWTVQARADVRRIERPTGLQILKTLARHAQTGEGNTKQLQGIEPPLIRLRARDHRVFSATRATTSRSPARSIARRLTAEHMASRSQMLVGSFILAAVGTLLAPPVIHPITHSDTFTIEPL